MPWLICKELRDDLRDLRPFFLALAVALVAGLLDILSSLLPMPASMAESNPFARHPDGTFWLFHGLVLKGMGITQFALAGLVLYFLLRRLNGTWAKIASLAPLLYFAYCWLDAAINNF